MTTQQKVDGCNNLETIYDESLVYLATLTHSSLYYTKGECSKYFSVATDGTGSGLIAEKLDGYTAQQIIDAGTPSGCIGLWSGSKVSIPSGWFLADGTNSTPNLQDRFVVGAGGQYAYGASGGSDTVTTAASVTIAGHVLTAAEIPLHTHGTFTDIYAYEASMYVGGGTYKFTNSVNYNRYTSYTGSGSSHGHTASFSGTASQDKRPVYYALCYIMKS